MKRTAIAAALLAISGAASAADINQLQNLSQTEFRALSEDLGAAFSYKALAPAEALGITGFDVGVETTATNLQNTKAFDDATGNNWSTLPVAKVHAHKGLPFGIDVGGFYASVPSTDVDLMGLEVRYALIDGGIAMPALAVRGTWSRLGGVDQLDLDTRGLELTVSKGVAMLTPYAGVGRVWVNSSPNNVTIAGTTVQLEDENFSMPKVFAGANMNLGLMNFALEADKTGDATTYGLKVGLRF